VRFIEKKQKVLVGFRERNNPRYITEIQECPVVHARVDKDMMALRALIDSMEDKHCITQIEIAAGDDEVALIFRNLRGLTATDKVHLTDFAQHYGYKIFLQPGGPQTVHCFYPEHSDDYLTYSLPDYGITFQFHPTDFTQVNTAINRNMVRLAIELMELNTTDKVLDLFCGLGNFSLPMATLCCSVVGVEGSEAMVDRARMNAKNNGLTNATFYAANLDDANAVHPLVTQSFDKVLIDPPRSGALELMKQMDVLSPRRIVYVSCNPITLARDSDLLVNQKGYQLLKAGVMDMFPHTTHVESIAVFEKG